MKRKLLLFLALTFYTQTYSQNSEEFIPSDAHSPNATELGSYGFMPVSYYTGRANVSIPIFSTEQRGVPMSITLDYNTSGIPANGLPGWTGIGWTLNTGGVITRSVKGIQDEYKCHQCLTPVGFQNYFESHGQLLVDKGNTANNYELLRNNVEQYKYDYAPDVFYFNFMGRHGSFFLGQDGEWKIRCDENLDVLLDPDDESSLIYPIFETCPGRPEKQPKCIKGFTLVDERGTRYVFGGENEYDLDYIEFSIPLFRTSEGDQYTGWTANSWYLKRVEDRFGNTLYTFNYERGKFLIEVRNDYEYRRITGHDFDTFYTYYFSVPSSNSLLPYNFQIVSPVYMTDITMPDCQMVEFVMDKTIELSSHDLYSGLYRIGDLYNK